MTYTAQSTHGKNETAKVKLETASIAESLQNRQHVVLLPTIMGRKYREEERNMGMGKVGNGERREEIGQGWARDVNGRDRDEAETLASPVETRPRRDVSRS